MTVYTYILIEIEMYDKMDALLFYCLHIFHTIQVLFLYCILHIIIEYSDSWLREDRLQFKSVPTIIAVIIVISLLITQTYWFFFSLSHTLSYHSLHSLIKACCTNTPDISYAYDVCAGIYIYMMN